MRSAKKINLNVKLSVAKVHDRALRIIKNLLGKRVSIYDGRQFVSLLIREHHIGYRFGQFIKTKKMGSNIHKDLKKGSKKGSKK
jgi:ribosomal protein S19